MDAFPRLMRVIQIMLPLLGLASWGPIAECSVGQSETISLLERQSRRLKWDQETRLLFYYDEEKLNELRPKVVVQAIVRNTSASA